MQAVPSVDSLEAAVRTAVAIAFLLLASRMAADPWAVMGILD